MEQITIEYLRTTYPEEITKDQFYRICHISKKTASYLLESGTENEDPKGTTDIADAASSFSASKETEMTEPEETVSETKPSVTTEQPATTEKKETVSTTPTETKQSVTTTEPQKTQPKETEPPVTTEEPVIIPEVKRPSASEIEAKTAEYINQYRLAQGDTQTVILPGLTAVAE